MIWACSSWLHAQVVHRDTPPSSCRGGGRDRLGVDGRDRRDADVDLGPVDVDGARPSCGKRRSEMFRPAMILRRDSSPFAMLGGGAGTDSSMPSMRNRTCRACPNGSICRSVARCSTASRSRSSMARTTGAPRARSRRSSRFSSALSASAATAGLAFMVSSRVARAASMSSAVATAMATGRRRASSTARTASRSVGAATASDRAPEEILEWKQPVVLQEAPRQLLTGETAADQVGPLHPGQP